MRTFRVDYKEEWFHTFYIEAESEDQVPERLNEMAQELDWNNADITGDIINIEEEQI